MSLLQKKPNTCKLIGLRESYSVYNVSRGGLTISKLRHCPRARGQ
ncbi:unnamed protein product [Staurois parvus]|uniref:Ribosomal protein S14 n=1 Tax=Staurois parvus TaxID=386267 RepID=A0ABN9GYJ0_9NEOB|nr:unnamed protein product [Staurois parvus]